MCRSGLSAPRAGAVHAKWQAAMTRCSVSTMSETSTAKPPAIPRWLAEPEGAGLSLASATIPIACRARSAMRSRSGLTDGDDVDSAKRCNVSAHAR